MTFGELSIIKEKYENSKKEYAIATFDYLYDLLEKADFNNRKTVIWKRKSMKGILEIGDSTIYASTYRYEIKFYPLKKDGTPSLNSRYVMDLSNFAIFSKSGLQHLKSVFEVCDAG